MYPTSVKEIEHRCNQGITSKLELFAGGRLVLITVNRVG